MAAEIDPVIFEFHARTSGFLSDLKRTTRTVDQQLGLQEKRAKRLESEMRRSSGAIGNTLKGLAGTLAAAFTGRELVGLIDSFTRLQNELRVAGLEGEALGAVQERLFLIANKNGVAINSLADLYGKAAQSGQELGASQEQLLGLTEATSFALRISGTNAQAASGAILGLSQALSSGTVRAEEFNQINEGGLRPLLQAAAGAERFGGSVAKLRAAVLDGELSSKQFFDSILAGSDALEGKASKATLTLSGAFETLNNSLIEYVGGSADANGATEALANGIKLLAENLEPIIEALSIIGVALGSKYVAGATLAAASNVRLAASATGAASSMGLLGAAAFAANARMAGAATSAEALRFAMAGLGKSLPLIAITALIAGLAYVAFNSESAADKTERLQKKASDLAAEADQLEQNLKDAGVEVKNLGSSADGAAGGVDGLTRSMETARKKAAELADQAGFTANKLAALGFQQAKAERQAIENQLRTANTTKNSQTRSGDFLATKGGGQVIANLEDQLSAAKAVEAAALRQQRLTAKAIGTGVTSAAPTSPSTPSATDSKKPKKTKEPKAPKGRSGPSAEDIEARFQAERANIAQQTLGAQQALATNAEDRAELELRSVELARVRANAEIKADADYSQVQKDRLTAAIEDLAAFERATIEREKQIQLEREAADIADERYRATDEALRLQYDLADTQAERKDIALAMLDLEDQYRRSVLEGLIASETETDARKKLAQIALDSLNQSAGARRESESRRNETEAERYSRGLNKSSAEINVALDAIKIDALEDLNDGLVDAIMGAKSLGDVFKNVANSIIKDLIRIAIQQTIIKGLSAALGLGSGDGSTGSTAGGLTGAVGSIFGRASGGYVNGGQLYRVNEGSSPGNVEGFMPTGSGQIVPLGRMNAAQGGQGGSGIATVRLELSGDIDARIERISGPVAIEVTRQAAPAIIDASANETLRRSGRPRL